MTQPAALEGFGRSAIGFLAVFLATANFASSALALSAVVEAEQWPETTGKIFADRPELQ